MKAVVVDGVGGTPSLTEVAEPSGDLQVADVVAAALNPVDAIIASGRMPFRPLKAGAIAGLEGVARTATGELRYFFAPPAPYGAFAERVALAGAETVAVPDGLDAATAAALGVSGLAAWLALTSSNLSTGDTVLILGAGGAVGRLAVQFARILGAGRVIGVARGTDTLAQIAALGADATVSSEDTETLAERLRAAAPAGVDVVIDMLWGNTVVPAIAVSNQHARFMQVGNAAGAEANVNAPVFRNKLISLTGHSNFAVSAADRIDAYQAITAHAAKGEVSVDFETVPFASFDDAWQRLTSGRARTKLILQP